MGNTKYTNKANAYPLISVIVPIFNMKHYLQQCVCSIQDQTYENLEIILVDDGSSDGSGVMCDKYAEEDDRIIVIHQSNHGLSAARNKGLDSARGSYLVFVDSDDYIDCKMIEKLYTALIENDTDLAICNFARFVRDSITEDLKKIPNEVFNRSDAFEKLDKGSWHYIPVWNKLYKKQVFQNLRFPEGRLHEDEAVIHWVFNACNTVVSIEDTLYYYRTVNNSIMNSGITYKRLKDINYSFTDRMRFYELINRLQGAKHTAYKLMRTLMRYYYYLNDAGLIDRLDIRNDVMNVWRYMENTDYLPVKESISIIVFIINPTLYKWKWGIPKKIGA